MCQRQRNRFTQLVMKFEHSNILKLVGLQGYLLIGCSRSHSQNNFYLLKCSFSVFKALAIECVVCNRNELNCTHPEAKQTKALLEPLFLSFSWWWGCWKGNAARVRRGKGYRRPGAGKVSGLRHPGVMCLHSGQTTPRTESEIDREPRHESCKATDAVRRWR